MPAKIVVPELGESVLEATVGHWRKKEGDRVSPGEVVVELETDKVDLEVGAEHDGVLAKIERKEGEDVRIGDVLGVIEDAAPAAKEADGAPQRPPAPPGTPAPAPTGAARGSRAKAEPAPVSGERKDAGASAATPTRTAGEISTPSARRLAREQGLNLGQIPVSGPG
ncbi:MAG: biotin/lipoyl-containing protein, partial [Terriglobia bacterium]